MHALKGVTVVIPNYNMGRFVAAAIESALAQDHPLVEVILVDDASTDQSRDIIAAYRGRVRTIMLKMNVGQTAALNVAWPLAKHPILIFLDSDDTLLPHAASCVAAAFSPTTAKVQFRLQTIDADENILDHISPKYPDRTDTEMIRRELLRTGSAPSTNGTGNAYAKWMLDAIKGNGGFNHAFGRRLMMDGILEINAPFYGEVITLHEVLACYRIHDSNASGYNTLSPARFEKILEKFDCKLKYMAHHCRTWGISFDPLVARDRCLWAFEYRLALTKLADAPQASVESPRRLLWLALRACLTSPYTIRQRLFRGVWLAAVTLLPRTLAMRLIATRFVIGERPPWLERFFHPSKRGSSAEVVACDR